MAFLAVQQTTSASAANGSDTGLTLGLVNAPTTGNFLVVWLRLETAALETVTFSDSHGGNTWATAIGALDLASASSVYIGYCYVASGMPGGTNIFVNWTNGSDSVLANVMEFSGSVTATPWLDVTASHNGSSTSYTSGTTATTAQAAELGITAFSDFNSGSPGTLGSLSGTVTSAMLGNPISHTNFAGTKTVKLWGYYAALSSTGNELTNATHNPTGTYVGAVATFLAAGAPFIAAPPFIR